MKIMGIDPGQKGAIVVLENGKLTTWNMKVVGPHLDKGALLNFLESQRDVSTAFLEEVTPMPKQNVKGVKTSCWNFGLLEMALFVTEIPYEIVKPILWTKVIHTGMPVKIPAKKKREVAFTRLFPRVPYNEGIMDAALIAEYGRRVMGI